MKHVINIISGRRIDSLEMRMGGSDQANRALLEQLMRLNQDMKVNRTFSPDSLSNVYQKVVEGH